MNNFRMIRVNALLKRVISEYLHTTFTAEAVAITITKVDTAPNLKTANVFFSVYNPTIRKEALSFLKKSRCAIQWGVGKKIRLKYMPQLHFTWDASLEKAHQTLSLMNQISQGPTVP